MLGKNGSTLINECTKKLTINILVIPHRDKSITSFSVYLCSEIRISGNSNMKNKTQNETIPNYEKSNSYNLDIQTIENYIQSIKIFIPKV